MVVKDYKDEQEVPEGIEIALASDLLTVKGPKGEVNRVFKHPSLSLSVDGNKIIFSVPHYTKREKTMLGTFKAHLRNMFKGVQEPFTYALKVCSGHFPMNITCSKKVFQVKNFIGEKIPRVLALHEGVDVKVEGDIITVVSVDKELAGQTAASIETLCKRRGFDKRIFQQGIFITKKAGRRV